ncbi:anillin-like isoform X2 [Limulus polyphemus]|uniref:Anillin-like isoform X2 n=1 Tax=Limulus polyphemus TaxID=6850 RepID=A0ABM1TA16_LIMPO|nr:anillin-like isoform X2 [Limulus polyphemus]
MESDIDPFTKKLLERTQARRENLNKKIAQMSEANSRKRRTPLTEEIPSSQFLNNDGAVPQDESPKRQCVDSPKEKFENYSKETPAIQVEDVEKENAPQDEGSEEFAVSDTLQGVRGLAALRRKKLESECMEVDSQPSSVVPVQFVAEHEVAIPSVSSHPSASSRSARLAALANQINNWEDDDSYHFPSKRFGDNITTFMKPVDETNANNTTNFSSSKTVTNSNSTNNTKLVTEKSCMAKNGATSSTTLIPNVNTTNASLDQNNKSASLPWSKTSPSKAGKVSGGGQNPNTHSSGFAIFNSKAGVQEVGKRKTVQKHEQQVRKVEIWDRAVISALEAQGFTKSPSASKINYNFNKENKAVIKEQTIQENTSKIPNNEKTIGEKPPTPSFKSSASLVLSKNTEVDSQRSEDGPPKPLPTSSQPSQEPKKNIDPSDLPLSARRALFEKAMRDGNSKAQQELSNPETLSVAARAALFDKSMSKASQPVKSTVTSSRPATSMTQSKQVSQPTLQTTKAVSTSETATKPNSPVKSVLSTSSTNSNKSSLVESPTSSASSLASPGKNVGMNTRQVQEQLLQKAQNDWRGNEISAKTKEERRREMTALMNRWERASSSSTCSETTNVDNPNKLTDTNKPQFLPSESSDVGNDVPDDVFQAEDLNSSESEASDIISEPENVPGPATSTCHFREPEENTCEKMNQEEDDDDEADLTGEAAAVCAEIDELLDEALDEEDEKEKEEKEFGTFDTNVSEKQVSVHQNGDSSSYTPQPPPKKTCAVTCTNFSL